jgi:hypothetical protein
MVLLSDIQGWVVHNSISQSRRSIDLGVNSLRAGGDICHQGRVTENAQNIIRLSKPTVMTIHWSTYNYFCNSTIFGGKNNYAFSEFFKKNLSLKS